MAGWRSVSRRSRPGAGSDERSDPWAPFGRAGTGPLALARQGPRFRGVPAERLPTAPSLALGTGNPDRAEGIRLAHLHPGARQALHHHRAPASCGPDEPFEADYITAAGTGTSPTGSGEAGTGEDCSRRYGKLARPHGTGHAKPCPGRRFVRIDRRGFPHLT